MDTPLHEVNAQFGARTHGCIPRAQNLMDGVARRGQPDLLSGPRHCSCRLSDKHPHAKVSFGFTGRRRAGKTTLMAGVAEALCAHGYSVSAVKCANGDDDRRRHEEDVRLMHGAGCREVTWQEKRRWVLMHEYPCYPQLDLAHILARMAPVDIVLVEGFEDASLPKIEVCRPSVDEPFIWPTCRRPVAVATDASIRHGGITLDLNAPPAIADFIITYLGVANAIGQAGVAGQFE